MHPWTAPSEKATHRSVVSERRDQLDTTTAHAQIRRFDPLIIEPAAFLHLRAEQSLVQLDGVVEVVDSHGDMMKSADVHGTILPIGPLPPRSSSAVPQLEFEALGFPRFHFCEAFWVIVTESVVSVAV